MCQNNSIAICTESPEEGAKGERKRSVATLLATLQKGEALVMYWKEAWIHKNDFCVATDLF